MSKIYNWYFIFPCCYWIFNMALCASEELYIFSMKMAFYQGQDYNVEGLCTLLKSKCAKFKLLVFWQKSSQIQVQMLVCRCDTREWYVNEQFRSFIYMVLPIAQRHMQPNLMQNNSNEQKWFVEFNIKEVIKKTLTNSILQFLLFIQLRPNKCLLKSILLLLQSFLLHQ